MNRLVLPGFFMALEKMLNQELAESLQEQTRGILDRVYPGEEKDLNWEVIYADKGPQDLCLDALIAIAPHFENIKRRQEWFLPIVNGAQDGSDEWELTERGFYNLVDSLFARLREALITYEGRQALVDRHGEEALAEAEAALHNMDHDRPGYG
ncbi:MAG: hypothetical protein QGF09_13710 [Rhodospirillales bacterium]|nr:hypothetical protein [Rhodospirillales bacterium]